MMEYYVIQKGGYYYRPNRSGYTAFLNEAGKYTLEEVSISFPNLDSPNQDGMSFIPFEEANVFSDSCDKLSKLDYYMQENEKLKKENKTLKNELSYWRQDMPV